jgi:hypothetical protein
LIRSELRNYSVKWLVPELHLFDRASLPINRFIVSRLLQMSSERGGPDLEVRRSARVVGVETRRGSYFVEYEDRFSERQTIACNQAVVRAGALRMPLTDGKLGPNRSVLSVFEEVSAPLT